MKRYLVAGLLGALLLPVVAVAVSLEGAVQKGSLSNQQLIQDAMLGVAAKVATQGCDSPESFEPYVMAMPQGEVGSRYWRETWVVQGCGTTFPISLRFSEDGVGAANWTIE